MKYSLLLFFLFLSFGLSAAEPVGTLYKGTINNRAVTLYLHQEPNPCGGDEMNYRGIYQYGTGKNWIELDILDNGKGNFCMTEHRFTGVLILKKNNNDLEGMWISPDGKTQLKVSFRKQPITAKQVQEMNLNLERTHYENDDC